jgi:hypothetical protein
MNESRKEQQKAKALSLGELTGAGAFAVGLLSAWLYQAGWTYAYHYFDRFGVPLLMVDIPKENYFVYGGIVVRQFPIWELGIGVIAIGSIALWRWLRLDLGRFKLPLAAIVVLAVFWIGHQAAVFAAHQEYVRQRESDYSAFPRVQIWRKELVASPDGSPRVSTDLANGCYRLLLHNQNRLFLLRSFSSAAAADLPVLILPWDQIAFVRVLPDHTSCE